jgi:hypothetical protein
LQIADLKTKQKIEILLWERLSAAILQFEGLLRFLRFLRLNDLSKLTN